jgi:alpha,alpha-trehalase
VRAIRNHGLGASSASDVLIGGLAPELSSFQANTVKLLHASAGKLGRWAVGPQDSDRMLTLHNLGREAAPALAYIARKWEDLRANARHGHLDQFRSWRVLAAQSHDGHLDDTDPDNPYILYLPNDFITPGGRFVVQFYWDSYFIILSLLRSNNIVLAKGMVENCFFLIQQHGMVIANRKRWAAGSQLPFLSQMVREVFDATQDRSWLATAATWVEAEYRHYWLNSDHLVASGLSRYHAPSCYPAQYIAAITMDHEATWDLSPRFDLSDVLHLLPVDLNSNLYAYERDLAQFHQELENGALADYWTGCAERRLQIVNETMWDERDGLYYDYNSHLRERKPIKSLATFLPLFHGLADSSQAKKVVNNLFLFEKDHGLATCDRSYGYTDRQWNYPIGWAPLHWLTYKGIKKSGHDREATRVALKWLSLNHRVWRQTGSFFEKYDVVDGTHEVLTDRYKNQEGFGWTNAVFHCLANDLLDSLQPSRLIDAETGSPHGAERATKDRVRHSKQGNTGEL